MFGSFDISGSALTAQRMRLDTIASNIASFDVTQRADGQPGPYKRLYPVFQGRRADGGPGVSVSSIEESTEPFVEKLEPGNPMADANGYVKYPNVDLTVENVNALEATRAYEANVTAIETTKSMMNATMRVLA
jgi:flagellar basal-body rod protein FlgC